MPGELVVFRTPMRLVEGFESGQVAEGTEFVVEATPDGISYEVTATDLTPGNAYTMWLFITNHPEHCVDNPEKDPLAVCGSADVYANSEMTGTSLVRGLGWVACEKRQKCVTTDEATVIKTKENSGTLTMTVSGTYPADEAIEERIEMVGDGILSNPLGAEYQVGGFIDHGPYDNETYENDEQIRRSTGGCAPVPDVEHYCPELFGTGARTQAPIKCIQGIRCFVIDPTSDAWQP